MKKKRWQLKIITITRERIITRTKPNPPANSGAVASLIAFSPRSRKATAKKVIA
jgi:hypothetical protein